MKSEIKALNICINTLDDVLEPHQRERIVSYLKDYVDTTNENIVSNSLEATKKALKMNEESLLTFETWRENVLAEHEQTTLDQLNDGGASDE